MAHVSRRFSVQLASVLAVVLGGLALAAEPQGRDVALPAGVRAVWDASKAYREATPTRERMCINGLWRFRPAGADDEPVPQLGTGWGYFKVPGAWPARSGGDQDVYAAPEWEEELRSVDAAWYARDVQVPADWGGRRIAVQVQWLNSYGRAFVDGQEAGAVVFPGGEVDITTACVPGRTHQLALQVFARRLNRDQTGIVTAEGGAGRGRGGGRRGLLGDVFLVSTPARARIDDIKVDTSVRRWQLTVTALLGGLEEGRSYALRARVLDGTDEVLSARSEPFTSADLENGRRAFSTPWQAPKLWDADTPQNTYEVAVELLEGERTADAYQPVRFGFREFWVDGRDFYLNGTRVGLRAVPLDSAQMDTAHACYEGARETMERYMSLGFNAVYTHNYGCSPGSHNSFDGVLKAADDLGMLLCFSLPQMSAYDWSDEGSVRAYERHVEWYVRQSQNHPAVIMYSQNHNSLGFSADQDPQLLARASDLVLGEAVSRPIERVLDREAVLRRFDATHPVYNHAGPGRQVITLNCYLNWVPMQERAEWFWPWAREGNRALFLVEYGEPLIFSYSSIRRSWEQWRSPQLHQQFYTEWGAQVRGDAAFELSEFEKARLRWEAGRWRAKQPFLRYDYPVGDQIVTNIPNVRGVQAEYIAQTWPAFRTLGLSGFNIWHAMNLSYPREGLAPQTVEYQVDWENLQRPGLSADRASGRGGMPYSLTTSFSDWPLSVRGEALRRYNRPLLAYIAGKPSRFTARGHNYLPGQTVENQIIVVNDSRRPVDCVCEWSVSLPEEVTGTALLHVDPGQNGRAPVRFELPRALRSGGYDIRLRASFSTGEVQEHSFAIHVLPPEERPDVRGRVAVFDPKGETAGLLSALGVPFDPVAAEADLGAYDLLVIGKQALTVEGPAPDLSRVRDGLKAMVFEQEFEPLERRLGFRVQEYGLRRVFVRSPGHPILDGLSSDNLYDWHGEATLLPPYMPSGNASSFPMVQWCGFTVPRPGRAGCQGNVSSVMIEKPARGDFLPLVHGGFGARYSPLMVYREGRGMVVFCQMDVTGRTEGDPAARRLAGNILEYASSYSPPTERSAVYAGEPAGLDHLKRAGADVAAYQGQSLREDQVLVVGPGGAGQLSPQAGAVAAWLKGGGQMLALGLSQAEADSILPFPVRIEQQEHISSYFEPPPAASLLAGIACGDAMIRDPRALPLVVGGAQALGNGVLARAEGANVAFCQLAPWQFDYKELYNTKMAFQQTSFVVNRLLANMGVRFDAPLLGRFGEPLVLPLEPPAEFLGMLRIERDDKAMGLPEGWKGLPLLSGGAPDGWAEPGFDDSGWRDVAVSRSWEGQFEDVARFDGVFLYRLKVTVPPELAAGEPTLVLGAIDDEDRTYVNGKLVGSITRQTNPEDYWEAARRYRLPPGTLVPGENTIAVEVTDVRQSGGITGFALVEDIPPLRTLREHRRWLDGLYLDEPEEEDDPYRYFRW